jgi:hypothetical protein
VLARNYTTSRDFDTFSDIQKTMHAEFKAAGMFDAVKEQKPAKEKKAKAA